VSKKKKPKPTIGALIGVGLDNTDGHKRATMGEKFAVVGGSAETHEQLTETFVKTFEELKSRGKQIQEVEREELSDIIRKSLPR